MKKIFLGIVLLSMLSFSCQEVEKNAIIRANQLGYYPNSVKKALVIETKETEFEIRKKADNELAKQKSFGVKWTLNKEIKGKIKFKAEKIPFLISPV